MTSPGTDSGVRVKVLGERAGWSGWVGRSMQSSISVIILIFSDCFWPLGSLMRSSSVDIWGLLVPVYIQSLHWTFLDQQDFHLIYKISLSLFWLLYAVKQQFVVVKFSYADNGAIWYIDELKGHLPRTTEHSGKYASHFYDQCYFDEYYPFSQVSGAHRTYHRW